LGDHSGWSISLSSNGDVLAVGALDNDADGKYLGHVRVYSWNGTSYAKRGADIDGEAAAGDANHDNSGYSVSLSYDGSVLSVGAPWNDDHGTLSGHVCVYSWNDSSYAKQGPDIDGKGQHDVFGHSVALSHDGNVLAVGTL
jgi:hypothetical protein